jgi:hypothetical protein
MASLGAFAGNSGFELYWNFNVGQAIFVDANFH